MLYEGDCLEWLKTRRRLSIHAAITDPPFSFVEYSTEDMEKLRSGRGGIWRIPPSIGGSRRRPLPRFSVLSESDIENVYQRTYTWATALNRVLVPGAHAFVASQQLLSYQVTRAFADAGYEVRGQVVRLVRTFRGGDRPKGAEAEFPSVSASARASWEPWLIFRKPLEGTLAENLRKWGTGGLRRSSRSSPFRDVISSGRPPQREKSIAPHPTLKPQTFLRELVRASLPLGKGVILDCFAGSGSTLAACAAVGYRAVGVELDSQYVVMAASAIPQLAVLYPDDLGPVGPAAREATPEELSLPGLVRLQTAAGA